MSLDIGSKTIGLAISDESQTIASPLEIINRVGFAKDMVKLQALLDKHQIVGLVVGLPLLDDGQEGVQCEKIRKVMKRIDDVLGLPFVFWDESHSSSAAEAAMLAADMSREKRGKAIDKLAAAYFLQGYLESVIIKR